MRKVYLLPLGCFRNQVDAEKYAGFLAAKGYKISSELSEVVIIFTCAFIAPARQESVEAIKEALALKKRGKIKKLIIAGCLTKLYWRDLLAFAKGIDALWGVDIVNDASCRHFLKTQHTAYLKVSEGCSFHCSYCRIPAIKGRLRSRSYKSIIKEVEWLNQKGVKELNIIGQDTTSWGKDIYQKRDFAFLLRKIAKAASNIKWIRILYAHPLFLNTRLIETIASLDKVCNYLDIPLQHINDRILKLMRRQTSRKYIIRLLGNIRKRIPDISLRTTFIVGFPTEKEKEFKELLDFVEDFRFKNLSAFVYSREENTYAAKLTAVGDKKKKERFRRLMLAQRRISESLNQALIGKEFFFLVDEKGKRYSQARSYHDAYEIDGASYLDKSFKPGTMVKGKVTAGSAYDLMVKAKSKI